MTEHATLAADPARRHNWMGVTSMVIALTGGAMMGMPGLAAGIVFGHMAVAAARRGEATNEAVGKVGLILNYVYLAVVLVVSVVFVVGYVLFAAGAIAWCIENPASPFCES